MFRPLLITLSLLALPLSLNAADKAPPKSGDTVKDFELPALEGGIVKLSDVAKDGPVAVVVLRGFPGYQCPVCRRQVGQYVGAAEELTDAGTKVLMIYPGEIGNLKNKAQEFLGTTKLPEGFQLLLDPGYSFTNAWNLRWDAPRETAYPSTFVIDKDLVVKWAKVSETHKGRTSPEDVLGNLPEE